MTFVSVSDEKIVIQDDVETALRLEMFTFAETNYRVCAHSIFTKLMSNRSHKNLFENKKSLTV